MPNCSWKDKDLWISSYNLWHNLVTVAFLTDLEYLLTVHRYHSHFSAQYGDGVVGPIIIHGPASADYDEDLGPIMVQDW